MSIERSASGYYCIFFFFLLLYHISFQWGGGGGGYTFSDHRMALHLIYAYTRNLKTVSDIVQYRRVISCIRKVNMFKGNFLLIF